MEGASYYILPFWNKSILSTGKVYSCPEKWFGYGLHAGRSAATILGHCFQVCPDDLSPRNKFEFWYRSNRETIKRAVEFFGRNFITVEIEDLCFDRYEEMRRLLEFVGLDPECIPSEIWQIPRIPSSYGRWKQQDTGWISSDVKDKLGEIGYEYGTLLKPLEMSSNV